MTCYWFKPKRYGYGATPVTWEGWAIVQAGIAVVLIATPLLANGDRPALWHWIVWLVAIAGTVIWLTAISHRKTDGEWRWRWGWES
jgi:hypothetical protein